MRSADDITRVNKNPLDHAYDSQKGGYYYEAIGILHGYIEGQLRFLFMAHCTYERGTKTEKAWLTTEKFDFKNLSNIVYALQLITEKHYQILLALNSLRNEIVHKYFYEPFKENYKGISSKKFASVFRPSYDLAYDFNEKLDRMHAEGDEKLMSNKNNIGLDSNNLSE